MFDIKCNTGLNCNDCTGCESNLEPLFSQAELDIDFTTCVNMLLGMDYNTAYKEAVKDYREYNKATEV
jgi:hypothetical protein